MPTPGAHSPVIQPHYVMSTVRVPGCITRSGNRKKDHVGLGLPGVCCSPGRGVWEAWRLGGVASGRCDAPLGVASAKCSISLSGHGSSGSEREILAEKAQVATGLDRGSVAAAESFWGGGRGNTCSVLSEWCSPGKSRDDVWETV